MKVWVVAGGTGGHFYPGLAVAKECLSKGDTVRFLVRKKDFVLPLLSRENIPFTEISAAGFRRSLHPINLLAPFKLILGFLESFWAVIFHRPDVVIVMGGYLSVPPAVSAWLFRIPLVLHEQNVLPGLANRLLSVLAKKVAVSFEESQSVFGGKAVLTGNPIRPEFTTPPSQISALKTFRLDADKKTILVFGGSLGARAINEVVQDVLKSRKDLSKKIQLLHFTGAREEQAIQKIYAALPFTSFVAGYCHDMVAAYAAADFVVCRAGASTITELIAVRKPAFLIPYPFAAGDHQTKNAQVLEKAETALVCAEGSYLLERLTAVIDEIVSNANRVEQLGRNYANIKAQPLDAARKIKDLTKDLVCKY